MGKYKDGNFIQFPRSAFPKLALLKTSSKWLYVVLTVKELQLHGLINKWQMHWLTEETKTGKSKKHITAFRLPDV